MNLHRRDWFKALFGLGVAPSLSAAQQPSQPPLKITALRVTPIALPDPPLLAAGGCHGPYFLRTVLQLECDGNVVGIPSTVLVSRRLVDEIGGFDPQMSYCADWDLWLQIALRTRFAYHPDPVFRLIACLRDDLLPSMREVAAGELAREGPGRPEAVDALVYSACKDPAPSVRMCCVYHLGELRVKTHACLAALEMLQQRDKNEGVRAAASAVLTNLRQP